MSITPVEAFTKVLDELQSNAPFDPDINEWLLNGFTLYLEGSARTIDEALSLDVAPGKSNERLGAMFANARRNALVSEVIKHIPGSPNGKAKTLSEALRDPESQHMTPECQQAINDLISECPDVAKSRSRLCEIIKEIS